MSCFHTARLATLHGRNPTHNFTMVFQRSFWVVLVIVLAACLNVIMNFFLQRASERPSYATSIQSPAFLAGLAAGTVAVLFLLVVYRSGYTLARAVLILGATSVIVGVTLGVTLGNRLRATEWALFAVLLMFYLGSWLVRA